MGNAFAFYGDPNTRETERFVRTFDKFFDCLNVRSLDEHRRKRKPNLKPYTSSSDERLTVSIPQNHNHYRLTYKCIFLYLIVAGERLFGVS